MPYFLSTPDDLREYFEQFGKMYDDSHAHACVAFPSASIHFTARTATCPRTSKAVRPYCAPAPSRDTIVTHRHYTWAQEAAKDSASFLSRTDPPFRRLARDRVRVGKGHADLCLPHHQVMKDAPHEIKGKTVQFVLANLSLHRTLP